MNRITKMGMLTVGASLLILSTPPSKALATDFSTMSMPSAMFSATNLATTTATNASASDMGNDFLSNQMNQMTQNQHQQNQQNQPQKANATGYVVKEGEKFFLTANNEKYEILTEKGDVKAVLPIVSGKEMPVKLVGQYNASTKQFLAEGMSLLKTPSDSMKAQLDDALKEYKKSQDISGIGKIITVDGKPTFSVNSKNYTILTSNSDVEVVLPLISETGLKVELIGQLDEDVNTFTAKRLNFKENPSKELIEKIDLALLVNKDGKEIDAKGTVVKADGKYHLSIFGGKYLIEYTRPDIERVLPVVADTDLTIKITGTMRLDAKKIEAKKLDIIQRPSDALSKKITEALKGYEEGNVQARGYILKKDDSFYLKIEDKQYKISAEKDDLKAFLGAVADEDVIIQMGGYISNIENTFDAKTGLVVGTIPAGVKAKVKAALEPYMDKPENGKVVDASGYITKEDDSYFIEVNFDKYKISSEKADLTASLPIIANQNLTTVVTGKIDTEQFTIKAEKLKVIDVPNKETQDKLKAVIAGGKTTSTGSTGQTANNSPFSGFGNFDFSKFPSFNQAMQGGTSGGTAGTTSSMFSNFDFSKFANFGSLSGKLQGGTGGTTAPANLSGMLQQLLGNKNVNGGTVSGSTSQMQLPSLSFDQIQQVLGKMNSSVPTGSGATGGATSNTSTNTQQSGGSGFSSGGSGFSGGGN